MNAVARVAARVVDTLAVVTFAGMFACVLAQVVLRYFFGSPLTWSDELARYLFVWCAFIGWVIAARRRSHLGVALVVERAPPRIAALLHFTGALASVAFAGVLLWYGLQIAGRNADVETVTLFFTLGVVYAIVPAAALAVGLCAIADAGAALVAFARTGKAAR